MSSKRCTLAQWLQQAEASFREHAQWRIPGVEDQSPRREAQWLLAAALSQTQAWLMTWPERELTEEQLIRAEDWLARRLQGEPLALLRGEHEFWSLPLTVTADTLIPRADTERLVEVALDCLAQSEVSSPDILDLGTGSGAIALALAHSLPQAHLVAVDRSAPALAVAEANGRDLGLSVQWILSDWFSALGSKRFHLIVSNPPYLAEDDLHLPHLQHEPRSALVAESNGMADLWRLVTLAPAHLEDHGWLLLEHGATQAEAVREALQQRGFEQVQSWQDLAGQDRVSGGQWCVSAEKTLADR